MSSYEELYGAHIVHKSKVFAELYSALQSMIKARTKAGYVNGITYIVVPEQFSNVLWLRETSCIKVKVWPSKGRYVNTQYIRDRLYISFETKR